MNFEPKSIFFDITKKEARTSYFIEYGITNSSYLINDAYVLRIPKKNKEKFISYKNEKNNYKVIEPLKLSEKVLYLDEVNGFKLTKFIHNTHFYSEINEEVMNMVSKMLKKLHGSGIKVPYGYMMFNRLTSYKKNIDEKYYISEDYEKKVIKDVQKIFPKEELTFCHNDLVGGNLLFRYNSSFIIDWENASMNNPLFDLASFISENNLTSNQEDYFLKRYFGYKFNSLKRKRVDIFVSFLDILFYYRALNYFFLRNEKIYLDIAKEKLERINFKTN